MNLRITQFFVLFFAILSLGTVINCGSGPDDTGGTDGGKQTNDGKGKTNNEETSTTKKCTNYNCGNGVCVEPANASDEPTCRCARNYVGTHCETYVDPDPCSDPNYCENGGICVSDKSNQAKCVCKTGFKGDKCETVVHPCDRGVCLNNGTCAKSGDSYTCNCDIGFTGDRCQYESGPFTFIVQVTDPAVGFGWKADPNYTYNYEVDCDNDNIPEDQGITGDYTCTYNTPGEQMISIRGTFPKFVIKEGTMRTNLLEIVSWGDIAWKSMEKMFALCDHLTWMGPTAPHLDTVEDLSEMFTMAAYFDGDLSTWDTSNIKKMDKMFVGAVSFKGDLSGWDVKNVTSCTDFARDANKHWFSIFYPAFTQCQPK